MLYKHLKLPAITSHFSIATVEQLGWLDGIVKAVIVLNLLDIIFTLTWVGAGHAREMNVLLIGLVSGQPVLFVLTKIMLVSLGSFLLWKYRSRPFAIVGIFVAFISYYYVLILHVHFTGIYVSNLV